jgi:hypothetical protein
VEGIVSFESVHLLANDCIPIYEPGKTITGHCSAGVTGKRFVKVTADAQGAGNLVSGLDDDALGGNIVVGPITTLGERALGVANRDMATGGKVGVLMGGVLPVTADAAITAWNEVMVTADGRVVPYAAGAGRYAVGVALADAADDTDCPVLIYGHPHLGAAA